jgi:1-acyl-sn-glycerol-3-phosphate acyltransferase
MIRHFKVCFAAKEELSRVPMLGIMAEAIGCIFVSREGTPEARDATVKLIGER